MQWNARRPLFRLEVIKGETADSLCKDGEAS